MELFRVLGHKGKVVQELIYCRSCGKQSSLANVDLGSDMEIDFLACISFG
jgi:hypothetical protein